MTEREAPFTVKMDNASLSVGKQGIITVSAPEIIINQEPAKRVHQS